MNGEKIYKVIQGNTIIRRLFRIHFHKANFQFFVQYVTMS